ncbi:ABC transporter [Phytophthora infestans]|uniref:ABC transporter n=2 Tax=Phytophthora infestans TaxID=4787 RepID=A0A8S9VGD5_PHYIN|nr:ABC transporter [Phytophthora infestans]
MVVGRVAAGKSSLVNAILGEMPRISGVLEVEGRVACVSQDTWIRNATLRDNILFEQEYDSERYAQVLEASQLSMDLSALPNVDATEIGERGINLSGGQKAQVAIARAMYRAGTDVLILDDPLSAVDPHVAHAIFNKCIVGMARDQTRLLVLNSHYDLLPKADHVVVMRDGVVAYQGPYHDVLVQFPQLTMDLVSISVDSNNKELASAPECIETLSPSEDKPVESNPQNQLWLRDRA